MYIHVHGDVHTDPSEVRLMVDGRNDQCSKGEDINFNHAGFSIQGQASSLCVCVGVCIHTYVCAVNEGKRGRGRVRGNFFRGINLY